MHSVRRHRARPSGRVGGSPRRANRSLCVIFHDRARSYSVAKRVLGAGDEKAKQDDGGNALGRGWEVTVTGPNRAQFTWTPARHTALYMMMHVRRARKFSP